MAKYSLAWTNTFLRTARKFVRGHPDRAGLPEDVLHRLENHPHDPRFRLHRLKGKHRDKHAISLTYSYRIILTLQVRKKEIILLDIGSHDKVYRP